MHDLRAASTEPPTSAGGPAPRLDGLSTHSAWHPWRRRAGETGSCFTRSMCPPGSGLGGNWRPRLSAAGPRGSCSVFPNLSAQVQSEGTVIYPSASSPGSAQVTGCSRASRLSPPRGGVGSPPGGLPPAMGVPSRTGPCGLTWPCMLLLPPRVLTALLGAPRPPHLRGSSRTSVRGGGSGQASQPQS